MIVTKIEEFKKNRYKIYIDEVYRFVLYSGELRKFHIETDSVIGEATVDEILTEILPKRAKLRAMNLLMKRRLSEYGLRQKLNEGEYPQEIIDCAIDYVASFGYIDDYSYARDFIEYNKSTKSVKRIRNDLANKGIAKEIVDEILTEVMESDDPCDETGQIVELIRKKKMYSPDMDYADKQKMYGRLYRKGYSPESINTALHLLDITLD